MSDEDVYDYVMDSRAVKLRERVRLAWCIVAGIPVVYRGKNNPETHTREWWDRTPVAMPEGTSVSDFVEDE